MVFDHQLAEFWNTEEEEVRRWREEKGIEAVYKQVDTCAGIPAETPYYYSTYEEECEANPQREKRQSF